MATTDNELNDLIINDISQEEYDNLVATGQVQEGQIYATDGAGGGGDIDISHINNESVVTKDLTVGTSEGTLNLSITAGVATIATNNGLDIVSQTKFDTAPTTDDTTTWANANDTSLVTKRQVATALSESGGGDYLPLSGGTLTGALEILRPGSVAVKYDLLKFSMETGKSATISMIGGSTPVLDIDCGITVKYLRPNTVGGFSNTNIGYTSAKWKGIYVLTTYTEKLNNGADIAVPTVGGTLARLEDIDAIGGDGTTGQVLTKTDDGMAWQDGAKGGASLPILMAIWSDHILNDISWLRADTFSWQSGDVYKAAYEHLVEDLNVLKLYCWAVNTSEIFTKSETPQVGDTIYLRTGTIDAYAGTVVAVGNSTITAVDPDKGTQFVYTRSTSGDVFINKKTETIGDITITYYLAQDGHKICTPDQESNIVALYEKTGAADYYLLDTTNKQFKLPRKQKRKLIQAVKNTDGTWYNLYSDGWIEQGGTASSGSSSVVFPVAFSDTTYYFNADLESGGQGTTLHAISSGYKTTGCTVKEGQSGVAQRALTANAKWFACGYAAESAYASAGMRLEYYYVGNFEQSAIEQTAGLNTELFNGKADVSRVEVLEGYDYVVESQEPTADNNYTWYRKYKSGWVEQAGYWKGSISIAQFNVKTVDITLPIEMSDGNYYAEAECNLLNHVRVNTGYGTRVNTSTTMKVNIKEILNTSGTITRVEWYVCGQSA